MLAQCACAHPGHLRTPTYPTILGSRLLSRNSAAPLRVVNTNGTNLTLSMMRDAAELRRSHGAQARLGIPLRSAGRGRSRWRARRAVGAGRLGRGAALVH